MHLEVHEGSHQEADSRQHKIRYLREKPKGISVCPQGNQTSASVDMWSGVRMPEPSAER